MEFKGSIKISRYKVDKACINFKNTHNEMMKLIRTKKEELRNTIVPTYWFGINITFLTKTKYEQFGFEGDFYYRHRALCILIKEMLPVLPEGPVKNLLSTYNRDSFSNILSCYHQLDDLRKMETGDITINPQQANFVYTYTNINK